MRRAGRLEVDNVTENARERSRRRPGVTRTHVARLTERSNPSKNGTSALVQVRKNVPRVERVRWSAGEMSKPVGDVVERQSCLGNLHHQRVDVIVGRCCDAGVVEFEEDRG